MSEARAELTLHSLPSPILSVNSSGRASDIATRRTRWVPVVVREALGSEVTIAGNIDPASGVFSGTPDNIISYMTDIYEKVGNRFMVNAGCEIPSGTPNENLKALCQPIEYK